MRLLEGMSNRRVDEIPQLNAIVTAGCDQVGAHWMEVNSTEPVLVALTRHNVLLRLHVPDLPRAVIGNCCQDLLAHVQSKATDGARMSIDLRVGRKASSNRLVRAREEWIGASILRVRRVFSNSSSESRLSERILLAVLGTHALPFVALLDLLLNVSFILLDGCL